MNSLPLVPELSRSGATRSPAPSELTRRRFVQQSSVLAGGLALYGAAITGAPAAESPNKNPGAVIQFEEATKSNTDEIRIERNRTGTVEEHYRNFLDCVKSRNKPRSNELLALRVMTALNMGIHSFRTGRTWEYDAKSGRSRAVEARGQWLASNTRNHVSVRQTNAFRLDNSSDLHFPICRTSL